MAGLVCPLPCAVDSVRGAQCGPSSRGWRQSWTARRWNGVCSCSMRASAAAFALHGRGGVGVGGVGGSVHRAPASGMHRMHRGTMRCEHCSNHQMRRMPSEPLANKPPPPATRCPRTPGGACHGGGNRAVTSQPHTGQSTSYGDVKSAYGGAGGWDRRGCAKGAPKSTNRQGEEQHRHTGRGSHTKRDKGEHSRQGGGAQQGKRGNQNSGNQNGADGGACAWEAATTKGMAWPASPVATRCQGNPCSTGIRWGVSPAAQMGCLRNRSRSPSGADQP